MKQFTATLTIDDVAFVELALRHYQVFAEVSDKQGATRTAGLMRSQEFYAERFLSRLHSSIPEEP